MRQILSAVADCHVHGIIHRDLKPENFLYLDESEESLLKVTDFGLSEFFSLQNHKPFNDIAGSAFYVAPEVLSRRYGPSADLWSCGVMMYILLTGEVPFWGPTEAAIFREVSRGQLDMNRASVKSLSRQSKELMLSMLNRDPAVRPCPYSLSCPPAFHLDLNCHADCLAPPHSTDRDGNLTGQCMGTPELLQWQAPIHSCSRRPQSGLLRASCLARWRRLCRRQRRASGMQARFSAAKALAHPWISQDGIASTTPLDIRIMQNMQRFAGYNQVKKAILIEVAKTFDPKEIEHLQRQFALMDEDNSGTISIQEMINAVSTFKTGREGKSVYNAKQVEEVCSLLPQECLATSRVCA
jgi:serine/threonine protein kinase